MGRIARSRRGTFSLICLSYRNLTFLPQFLRSLAQVEYDHGVELIFVDDGTPNAKEVFNEHLADGVQGGDSCEWEVKVIIKQSNKGLPDSLRQGIENASGEFVKLISIDDYLLPQLLRVFSKALQHSSIVQGQYVRLNDYAGKKSSLALERIEGPFFALDARAQFGRLACGHCLVVPAMAFRRSVFNESTFLDMDYKISSEWPLMLRLTRTGHRVELSNDYVMVYRRHPSNTSYKGFDKTPVLLNERRKIMEREILPYLEHVRARDVGVILSNYQRLRGLDSQLRKRLRKVLSVSSRHVGRLRSRAQKVRIASNELPDVIEGMRRMGVLHANK